MSAGDLRRPPEISVVCAVTRWAEDIAEVHRRFSRVLADLGRSAEFLYILDGRGTSADPVLTSLVEPAFRVRVFRMARGFGESAALSFAFAKAAGSVVLTIPDHLQIAPEVLADVLAHLDRGHEVVVTRREPRSDAWPNRVQSRAFHALVRRLVRQDFRDLTCGVRGFTREAAQRLDLYGDQHRFVPVMAVHAGYEVLELPGAQVPENDRLRLRRPGAYVRRLLDIFTIYFLVRFTRKPLRFFGSLGASAFTVGLGITGWLAAQRILGQAALAGRPLLLLGVLLMVFGVQLVSIGLLGEIIIFLSSRRATPEVRELAPERLSNVR